MSAALTWHLANRVLTVGARRTLRGAIARIQRTRPEWVVVVREHRHTGETFHYAYRPIEITRLADDPAGLLDWTLEDALDLHEPKASAVSRARRVLGAGAPTGDGPASERVVDLDISGEVVAIGESARPAAQPPLAPRGGRRGIGFRRPSAGAELDAAMPPPAPPPAPAGPPPVETVQTSLSAQAPAELQPGAQDLVEIRIELAGEAAPLAQAVIAAARVDQPIVVSLSLENACISVIGPQEQRFPPPVAGSPRLGFFQIRAEQAGVVRAAVSFRQGGSELGSVALAMEVVGAEPRSARTGGQSIASPPDPQDGDVLDLLIEQRQVGGELRYEYRLLSEALGLNYLTLQSKPLLDRGGGAAATTLAYVDRIYDRVTRELKSADDLKALQRELRALGASLSDELFDPEVARVLWPLRERIGLIRIVSWEPYIPWELLRLRDPASGDIDERFFAEYGLVRSLAGEAPARSLALREWRWLAGGFEMATHTAPASLDWLTALVATQPGLEAAPVAARTDALLDLLADGEFDVLHLACHAESPQDAIDRATLILDDEATPGSSAPRLIEADSVSVKAEARLRGRRPLVFLNACESGRAGAQLTAWGGWPEVFLRAGAGAFVGTAWAVRDKPATAFANAFYAALLGGQPLHEAASAARQAAKLMGDGSWLAFKVYGHPRARREASTSGRPVS